MTVDREAGIATGFVARCAGTADALTRRVPAAVVNVTRRASRQRTLESRALARTLPAVLGRTVAGPGGYDDDVYRAVRRPTRRQRTAIRLRYWDDLTEHEVAVRMGIATGTAGALLSEARRRLCGALREPGQGGHR